MNKHIFLILLIIILSCPVIGQDLSIELSVSWEKGENYLKQDRDTINAPFLNVTYRNNSDIPVYFLKMAEKKNKMPGVVGTGAMIHGIYNHSNYDSKPKYDNYSEINYFVPIRYRPGYSSLEGWFVVLDSVYINTLATDGECIEDDLS